MIKIRTATENDIAAIIDIASKTWAVAYKDILTQEQRLYMLDMMYSYSSLQKQMEQGHLFFVAEIDEKVVGFLSCEVGYKGENVLKIHKYYVLPTMQGKGIGSGLLTTAEQCAVSQRLDVISLNVNRYNPAVEHYKTRGFSIVHSEDIAIGNGYLMEDFVMEKKITYI